MFGPSLPAAFTKRIIDRAWNDLSYIVQSHFSRELDDVLSQEMKEERAHRRMGARFTRGAAQYRLSAEYAAKLFVLRHVYEAPTSVDLADLGGLRIAVTMCYTLAARMRKTHPNARYIDSSDMAGPTMWDKWRDKTIAHSRPYGSLTLQDGGTVRSMDPSITLSHIMGRLERDTSISLDSPIFLTLDYAVDVAVH